MLNIAYKEWAAICRELGEGRQTILLRKGGIAEQGGAFRPDHSRFWLYPTHYHERSQPGLKPGVPVPAEAGPDGVIRLTHFVEVPAARFVSDLDVVLRLDPFHAWSEEAVRQRFDYRSPGVFVLPARVFRARTPVLIPERPEYAGCKTWVELADPAEELPADPVIPDEEWVGRRHELDRLLQNTIS